MQDLHLYIGGGAMCAVTIVAAITDLKDGKIYNWLTFPAMILGIVVTSIFNGWLGLGQSLLGIAVAFAVLILGFIWGGIGGGDIKLLMSVGAFAGWLFVLFTFVYAVILAAVFALILAIATGKMKVIGRNLKHIFTFAWLTQGKDMEKVQLQEKMDIRFGIFIAVGAIFHFVEVLLNWNIFGLKMP